MALGRLGEPSPASSGTWAAAGAAARTLHDAPLPPWPGRCIDEIASRLDGECEWLVTNGVPRSGDLGTFAASTIGDWKGLPRRRELGLLATGTDVAR
jgi:hypothetical protein